MKDRTEWNEINLVIHFHKFSPNSKFRYGIWRSVIHVLSSLVQMYNKNHENRVEWTEILINNYIYTSFNSSKFVYSVQFSVIVMRE